MPSYVMYNSTTSNSSIHVQLEHLRPTRASFCRMPDQINYVVVVMFDVSNETVCVSNEIVDAMEVDSDANAKDYNM